MRKQSGSDENNMAWDINKLVRDNVKNLKSYSSARDDFQGSANVYLDANENPYPSGYNRYPDPHQAELKKKIGKLKNISAENIFLGNGSDEPIDLLIRAFCEPGTDTILLPQPSYGMYAVSAAVNNIAVKAVNLTTDFDLDIASARSAWNAGTKLIFLCSPNNPTGNLLSPEKITTLLNEFHGLVIVDEAYIDFAGQPGFVPLLNQFPNLVVLQTFSKAWGLAAIRLGMCFASQEIISFLNKIKPPYNISIMAQQIASQALDEASKKDKWVMEILQQRKAMEIELPKLKVVKKVYRSDANFLLVKVQEAGQVYRKLVEKGIIVRDRSRVILCSDCLRITIGTPQENQLLLNELNRL
jgi:histidinol-phosphate aminotransferase